MNEEQHHQQHLAAEQDIRYMLNQHFDNDLCRMQVLVDVLAEYVSTCLDGDMAYVATRIVCAGLASRQMDTRIFGTPAGSA